MQSIYFSPNYNLCYSYDEITGESNCDSVYNLGSEPEEEDEEEEENSSADSRSDGGWSLGSEYLNADGEIAGFRD